MSANALLWLIRAIRNMANPHYVLCTAWEFKRPLRKYWRLIIQFLRYACVFDRKMTNLQCDFTVHDIVETIQLFPSDKSSPTDDIWNGHCKEAPVLIPCCSIPVYRSRTIPPGWQGIHADTYTKKHTKRKRPKIMVESSKEEQCILLTSLPG